jgi:hypothetical protein
MEQKIKINIKNLIKFYDQKENGKTKPASSISGLIGEDLVAGLFKHYLENSSKNSNFYKPDVFDNNDEIKVIDGKIKAKGTTGKMLDRWIVHKNIAYQTEIKNWSAHSLGGYDLSSKDDKEFLIYDKVKEIGEKNFNNTWGLNPNNESEGGFKDNSVGKVLLKMESDEFTIEKEYELRALVCFWMPIYDKRVHDMPQPFFKKNTSKTRFLSGEKNKKGEDIFYNSILTDKNNGEFNEVYFFSASIYLRYLLEQNFDKESIEITSKNIFPRVKHLFNLLDKDQLDDFLNMNGK